MGMRDRPRVLTVFICRHAARASRLSLRGGPAAESQERVVKSRDFVLIGAVLVALGCSSREVPSSFPAGSPASLSAAEAPRAEVARSLREDPPLPGESTDGWAGLEARDTAPAPSAHEHGTDGGHAHGGTPSQPAAVFTCPMHPEVNSDEPGLCPKCGMKLEPGP
jgi:hypothetical protein